MRRFVLLVSSLVLLAGCASAVDGSGSLENTPSLTAPSEPSASFPSSAPLSTPGPLSTPAPAPSTPAPTGSTVDFTTVTFPVPSDFEPGVGYGEAVPLEASAPIQDFIVPRGAQGGLDIVSVIIYVLPSPGVASTAAQQVARIKAYNAKLKVTLTAPITSARVAGLPAYTERVVQPGGSRNPRGYRYSTWFVFGTTHLAQISCQTDTTARAAQIAKGCSYVLANLRLLA